MIKRHSSPTLVIFLLQIFILLRKVFSFLKMASLKHIKDTDDAKTAGESYLRNDDGPQHETPIF